MILVCVWLGGAGRVREERERKRMTDRVLTLLNSEDSCILELKLEGSCSMVILLILLQSCPKNLVLLWQFTPPPPCKPPKATQTAGGLPYYLLLQFV